MMKHILINISVLGCIFIFGGLNVAASPAWPWPVVVTQPDGSKLTVRLYGDEFASYRTTSDGYRIEQDGDGFYYYVVPATSTRAGVRVRAKDPADRGPEDAAVLPAVSCGVQYGELAQARRVAANVIMPFGQPARQAMEATRARTRSGERFRSLVILVDFADVRFRTPNPADAFYNLLNQDGYSVNGATGSAWNYYHDNSGGLFDPEFVVAGPYTVSRNMGYYGKNNGDQNDVNVRDMVKEACQLAHADGIDFGAYADGGWVRDIFIFYAGYSEAEYAPANTIWPHRWGLATPLVLGGVRIQGYACAAELSGNSGSVLTGIGTFCHEFGHVIGWPDFYDVDDDTNGSSINHGPYALMASGNHNNNGRTPPALTAVERYLAGWLSPEQMDRPGRSTLEDVYGGNAYLLPTSSEGEYFLFETRDSRRNKWDAGLRSRLGTDVYGMMVTHVDRSDNPVPGTGKTARQLWDENYANAYAAHPCIKIVRAGMRQGVHQWMFPQGSAVTTLSGATNSDFAEWNGSGPNRILTDISYSNGTTSFSMSVAGTGGVDALSIYQNDAEFVWNSQGPNDSYNVKLYHGSDMLRSVSVDDNYVYVYSLVPGTEYKLDVIHVDSGIYLTHTFKTASLTSAYPSMDIKGTYGQGEAIPLRLKNVAGEIRSVLWTVDGEEAGPPYVRPAAGRHEISAVVTLRTGETETITKYVKVQ